MSDHLTVVDVVQQGKRMMEAQAAINAVLDESGLAIINKVILLDMMAFELKHRAVAT